MKKILFSLAAFAALATACQVEDINENITPEGEKYVIEAAIASTKTVYEPPFSVSWAEGDALSVVPQYADGSYAGYEFKWTDGTTFVSENVTNPAEIEALNVIYPSDLEYIKNIDSEGFVSGFTYFGSRSDAAQTQNGTDNASHIAAPLYGYATVTAEGTPVVEMKHASTLFEVIVTNNAGKEISVSNIKVTNSENKNMIGTFYINPQTGALKEGQYVSATANLNVTNGTIADNAKGNFYFTSAPFELAAGSTLTVTITTGDGESTIVKNITEASAFEAGKVNHINVTVEEIETIEYLTVAEALAVANESIVNVQGLVTAVNSRGCVLSDETGYVYIYNGSNLNVEVGDYIKVTGTRGEFNKADQIGGPSVIVVSSGNPVSYPEPKVLDGSAADSFVSSPEAGYVQITGELSVSQNSSGTFYNVIIPGANSAQGSISYPRDTDALAPYDGTTVTVSGYYVGISGSSYLNIMLTDIKEEPYCNVTPSTMSVTAEAGTTTFNISSNEYWMVESNNPAYTVSPEEGTGDATITVTYPANEGADPVEVVFTVLSDSGVEKTVTLTQRTASQTTVEVTDVLTSDLFAATSTSYTAFSDVSVTSSAVYAGKTAKSTANGNAIQLRSSGSDCGIVTTSSNGKVRKIVVDWHTATSGSRVLWVYGSNEPFTSASELYNNTKGERIAEIKMGDTTFEVEGDYSYIGLRSNSGAMYINSISITWEE